MPQSPSDDEASIAFLHEEYRHLAEAFLDNERMGERRVTWLITLVTAALGAVGAVFKFLLPAQGGTIRWAQTDDRLVSIAAVSVLLLLLLFGLVTLQRIAKRNIATDTYLNALVRIRRFFVLRDKGGFPMLGDHLPFLGHKDRDDMSPCSLWPGGLAQTVALTNSVVAAAIAALITGFQVSNPFVIGVAGVFFGANAWLLQCALVNRRYAAERRKARVRAGKSDGTEREVAFVSPGGKAALAAALDSLAGVPGLALGPARTRSHTDRYYDTPDGRLSRKHAILRTRTSAGGVLLGCKGRSRSVGGAVERPELEAAWSRAALASALAFLGESGIPVDAGNTSDSAGEALRKLGFVEIQKRSVTRTTRDIGSTDGGWATIAEAALDRVIYELAAGEFVLDELEIEAKSVLGRLLLDKIAALLECDENVRSWPHGKTATGRALEELLRGQSFRNLVRDGKVGMEALERIGERLSPVKRTPAGRPAS